MREVLNLKEEQIMIWGKGGRISRSLESDSKHTAKYSRTHINQQGSDTTTPLYNRDHLLPTCKKTDLNNWSSSFVNKQKSNLPRGLCCPGEPCQPQSGLSKKCFGWLRIKIKLFWGSKENFIPNPDRWLPRQTILDAVGRTCWSLGQQSPWLQPYLKSDTPK